MGREYAGGNRGRAETPEGKFYGGSSGWIRVAESGRAGHKADRKGYL